MIQLYFLILLISVVTFLGTRKLSLKMRVVISLSIFLILSIVVSIWIITVGDKPLPGAVTVYPKQDR